jgi:lipoyl(octanoyl) transferase
MTRPIHLHRLGRVDYGPTLELLERLLEARRLGQIEDTVLLLEHEPVITLGRSARAEHLLGSREALQARGIQVFDIGRGGDVTYHGPGQLVGYPIVDLNPDRRDVRRYVRSLEEVMIRIAASYGLSAGRIEGLNGTWLEQRKLGAVGVRIRQWITMHGFALNVTTDLSAFDVIVPCGIRDKQVTSLAREIGREPPMAEVVARAGELLAETFDATPHWHDGPPELPTAQ